MACGARHRLSAACFFDRCCRFDKAGAMAPRSIPIYGYIYDITTGKLIEADGASDLGNASQPQD